MTARHIQWTSRFSLWKKCQWCDSSRWKTSSLRRFHWCLNGQSRGKVTVYGHSEINLLWFLSYSSIHLIHCGYTGCAWGYQNEHWPQRDYLYVYLSTVCVFVHSVYIHIFITKHRGDSDVLKRMINRWGKIPLIEKYRLLYIFAWFWTWTLWEVFLTGLPIATKIIIGTFCFSLNYLPKAILRVTLDSVYAFVWEV